MMKRENVILLLLSIGIALQGWCLSEIVALKVQQAEVTQALRIAKLL